MQYKALMLDVDGTLIPYEYDALPSEKVCKAIQKAQEEKGIMVCLVTGRSYSPHIEEILKKLHITKGYVVSDTGAHVTNIETQEVLYDEPFTGEVLRKVLEILFKHKISFYAKCTLREDSYLERPILPTDKLEKAYMLYADEMYTDKKIDEVLKELSPLSLSVNKTKHKHPTNVGINIMHPNATKLRGVEVVMQATGIKKEEIIAAGDSYNDFPLLMAAGLKVAMGNAIEDLKAIADYVAPSVHDDGVADVVEKYILK